MIINDIYRRQVALLIRVMPLVFKIKDFAVHGGTAINLFHKNLPRYSVDIDVTYIPLEDRETSLRKNKFSSFITEERNREGCSGNSCNP